MQVTEPLPPDQDSCPPDGEWDPVVEWLQAKGRPVTLKAWLSLAYPEANSLDDLDAEQLENVPEFLLPERD